MQHYGWNHEWNGDYGDMDYLGGEFEKSILALVICASLSTAWRIMGMACGAARVGVGDAGRDCGMWICEHMGWLAMSSVLPYALGVDML